MISLVMLLLKAVPAAQAVLADSISTEIWEISSEIFLEIYLAAEEEEDRPMAPCREQTFVPV